MSWLQSNHSTGNGRKTFFRVVAAGIKIYLLWSVVSTSSLEAGVCLSGCRLTSLHVRSCCIRLGVVVNIVVEFGIRLLKYFFHGHKFKYIRFSGLHLHFRVWDDIK